MQTGWKNLNEIPASEINVIRNARQMSKITTYVGYL